MNHQTILTEQDVKKLFKEEPKKESFFQTKLFREIIEWLVLIVIVFAVGYVVINWPTFALKLKYFYATNIKKQPYSTQEVSSPAFTPSEKEAENQAEIPSVAYLPDNRLYIDKINTNVPIVWDVPEDKILAELKNGLAHYQDTALPDQASGNIFITGHSSGYWWSKDLYNQVFALLDELTNGDKIALTYQGKKYTFEVYNKMVVKPSQVEVMQSSQEELILSLMTCVPVGTNLNRLIVQAKPILTQNIEPAKIEEKDQGETRQEEKDDGQVGPKDVYPQPERKEEIPDLQAPSPALNFLPDVN